MLSKNIIIGLFLLLIATTDSFGQSTTLSPAAQEAVNKAIVATKIPDYPLALTYFQEARKAAPQSAEIFFNLGLAESNIPGRELRAICWFGAYLTTNPAAPNAAAVKEQINTLDVKNRSSLIRMLNMVQDAAVQISGKDESDGLENVVTMWMSMGDLPAAIKAAGLIHKKDVLNKSYALWDIADAEFDAGDIAAAQKTSDQIPFAQVKCRQLLGTAVSQLKNGDTSSAQRTLAAAFTIAQQIHTDPDFGIQSNNTRETELLSQVGEAQAEAGDIAGAQKTYNAIKEKTDFGFEKVKTLSAIFLAQTLKSDKDGAQKTFSEAQRAFETIDKDYKLSIDWANKSMAEAQVKSGDITGGQKTAELIHDPESICRMQLTIASAQAKAGDHDGAQKTLMTVKKTVELIKESYNKVGIFAAIAKFFVKNGDMSSAKKTLAVAQDTADFIQDGFWKSYSNKIISEAYEGNGISKTITVNDWLKKLDDSNETDDCPLNTEPFLDLDSHLKSLVRSEDAKDVFEGLKQAAEKMVKARNILLQLLKVPAGK